MWYGTKDEIDKIILQINGKYSIKFLDLLSTPLYAMLLFIMNLKFHYRSIRYGDDLSINIENESFE